jgi:hypothetical protein
MFNRKEIAWVLVMAIILAGSISFGEPFQRFSLVLLSVFLVLISNVVAKKISAYYLESEIEIKLWEVQRISFQPIAKFAKPLPAGIILPLVISILTIKRIYWMACLVFDVKPKVHRTAKRHGFYSFSEMTELHIGIIAASGVAVNLLLGILGYLIGFEEFARLNLYYAFYSILPISDLDGNKIFFGNLVMWSLLAVLTLVGLGYAFLAI